MSFVLSLSFLSLLLSQLPSANAFSSPSDNNDVFTLTDYRKARALETTNSLDASRLHFQILFVDDDNAKGRIAEGLLARTAEFNDALFTLFPASATIAGARNAPVDATAPIAAVRACERLGLTTTDTGTAFERSYLDEYDLVVTMDDEIRSHLLYALSSADQEYYSPKCRLLSEFLSPEFCGVENPQELLESLDFDLRERVQDDFEDILDRSSSVVSTAGPQVEPALILASAGIARFCLDVMDSQFESAFATLLQSNFPTRNSAQEWDLADQQLRRCSSTVTGYFSPEQRRQRYERHVSEMSSNAAGE